MSLHGIHPELCGALDELVLVARESETLSDEEIVGVIRVTVDQYLKYAELPPLRCPDPNRI